MPYKFGGAEVGGVLFAKTRKMLNEITLERLTAAMHEVTMTRSELESLTATLSELLSDNTSRR